LICILEREEYPFFIISTVMSVHSWIMVFYVAILKTIQVRPRKVAVDCSESTLLSINNVNIEDIQLFKITAYSILISHVENVSHMQFSGHAPKVFMALSSKLYFLDLLEGAHFEFY